MRELTSAKIFLKLMKLASRFSMFGAFCEASETGQAEPKQRQCAGFWDDGCHRGTDAPIEAVEVISRARAETHGKSVRRVDLSKRAVPRGIIRILPGQSVQREHGLVRHGREAGKCGGHGAIVLRSEGVIERAVISLAAGGQSIGACDGNIADGGASAQRLVQHITLRTGVPDDWLRAGVKGHAAAADALREGKGAMHVIAMDVLIFIDVPGGIGGKLQRNGTRLFHRKVDRVQVNGFCQSVEGPVQIHFGKIPRADAVAVIGNGALKRAGNGGRQLIDFHVRARGAWKCTCRNAQGNNMYRFGQTHKCPPKTASCMDITKKSTGLNACQALIERWSSFRLNFRHPGPRRAKDTMPRWTGKDAIFRHAPAVPPLRANLSIDKSAQIPCARHNP